MTEISWDETDFSSTNKVKSGSNIKLKTDPSSSGSKNFDISYGASIGTDFGIKEVSLVVDEDNSSSGSVYKSPYLGDVTSDISDTVLYSGTANSETRSFYLEISYGDAFDPADFYLNSLNVQIWRNTDGGTTWTTWTVTPYYTDGTITGATKTFANYEHIFNSITINGNENGESMNTKVINGNGDSKKLYSTGTHSLSSLSPSNELTLELQYSSSGQNTPSFQSATVDATPAVQVLKNGSWQYKPVTLINDQVKDIYTYSSGSF
jgi:hypothetical protein